MLLSSTPQTATVRNATLSDLRKATAEQIASAADIPNILTLKDLKWVATANFKLHAFYGPKMFLGIDVRLY